MKKKYLFKVIRPNRTSAVVGSYKKYSIKYIKSFETKCILGTLGVFCFTTRNRAQHFIDCDSQRKNYKIIKVFPFGKIIRPKFVSFAFDSKQLDNFYKNLKLKKENVYSFEPGLETVCCPSVMVLE